MRMKFPTVRPLAIRGDRNGLAMVDPAPDHPAQFRQGRVEIGVVDDESGAIFGASASGCWSFAKSGHAQTAERISQTKSCFMPS